MLVQINMFIDLKRLNYLSSFHWVSMNNVQKGCKYDLLHNFDFNFFLSTIIWKLPSVKDNERSKEAMLENL